MKNNNIVIIIGNDHINTLGIIRNLGENNIKPILYLISLTKFNFSSKSKYIENTILCENEEMAVLSIIDKYSNSNINPIIIPSSDRACAILDANYDRLKEKFIIPYISNDKIMKYMDKYEQSLLFEKYGLAHAKTEIIEYPFDKKSIIKYPIIIKPVMSINGDKNDIKIVNSMDEYNESIIFFRKSKYKQILIQEFVKYEYECDIVGFSFHGNTSIPGFIKKVRLWPQKKGSTTFGIVLPRKLIENKIKKIINLLNDIKYNGIFDIDFFVKDKNIIINEINFRNGAISYAYGNSSPCYYYVNSCISNKFIPCPNILNKYYIDNELSDLHNVFEKTISIKQYFSDKNKSLLLVGKNKDYKPSFYILLYLILKKINLFNFLLITEKIYHKRKPAYVMKASNDSIILLNNNKNYKVIEINDFNTHLLNKSDDFIKKYRINYNKGIEKALILTSLNNDYIGNIIIRSKGYKDSWVSINKNNTYELAIVDVEPKYRGKTYQNTLIVEAINHFIKSDYYEIYAIIFCYNIPSWKNIEKLGFKKIKINSKKVIALKRLLNLSLNKLKI